jgi:hypothetical protein
MNDILVNSKCLITKLRGVVQEANACVPTKQVHSALTRACQAIGWSGKTMMH